MQKKDLEQMDAAARAYFNSLPPVLQASIMQSGVTMTTKEELMEYFEHAINQKD